jgi:hypothetical protein
MAGKRGNPNLVKGGPSINPKGRAPGSKNPLTTLQNELIDKFSNELSKDFGAIIRKIIRKAKDGDMVAAKMLLDRAIPARKAVEHYGLAEQMGGINIIISNTEGHKIIEHDDISQTVIENYDDNYDEDGEDDE